MAEQNEPLENLTREEIKKIKAVTFDIDGVIVPTGTFLRENADGTELLIKTKKLRPETVGNINRLKKHFWINFSSGRSLLYLQSLLNDILWEGVSLTAENGNFILMDGRVTQLASYGQKYFQKLSDIRASLKKLKNQKPDQIFGFEPKLLIITVHTAGQMSEIPEIVRAIDTEGELYCQWTLEGYDIGAIKTDKRTGLDYLCRQLKIKPEEMITMGNNVNDREMLEFGLGISVDPERVAGRYAVARREGLLGGEEIAKYLLNMLT